MEVVFDERVEPLIALCEAGSIYAVERWIQDGKPLQVVPTAELYPMNPTALTTAIEQDLEDLFILLLCNGYDPNGDAWSPLDSVLDANHLRFVDLLCSWGADLSKADPKLVIAPIQPVSSIGLRA